MRIIGLVIGALLVASGVIWMLQGVDSQLAPQSFMTSDPLWIVIGALTSVGGISLAWWSWTRR